MENIKSTWYLHIMILIWPLNEHKNFYFDNEQDIHMNSKNNEEVATKVDIWKTLKIRWIGLKEWLAIRAIVFRDGVEEMMRNASCFIILFLNNNYLHFP